MGRDPIEENGGINLYGFVSNNPVNRTDFLGLFEWYYTGSDGVVYHTMPHITDSPGDFRTMSEDAAKRWASSLEGTHAGEARPTDMSEEMGAFRESYAAYTASTSGSMTTTAGKRISFAVQIGESVVAENAPNNAANVPAFGPATPNKPASPPGSFEVFLGLDGDLVGVTGGEGAAGLFINFKHPTQSGVYGSIGPAAGANVGVGVNAGFARRGVAGWSGNIDANVGAVSPTVSFDRDGFNGLAVGVGPGKGLSVSAVKTGTYTFSDFGSDVKRAWNWLFGPGP